MDRKTIFDIIRSEFSKHRFDTFVDEPASVARGGQGVVVPGCVSCKARLQTTDQFVDHLSEKVIASVEQAWPDADTFGKTVRLTVEDCDTLINMWNFYRNQAVLAANNKAFGPAIVFLVSGLETALVSLVLTFRGDVEDDIEPLDIPDGRSILYDLIEHIPHLDNNGARAAAHELREMRNCVHPLAGLKKEHPKEIFNEQKYERAIGLYNLVVGEIGNNL